MTRGTKLAALAGLLTVTLALGGCGGRKAEWTAALPVAEETPGPTDLRAYPPDGQSVAVNPPGFCWTPGRNAKSYRLEVKSGGNSRLTLVTGQSSTVYAAPRKLEPGEYAWQVVYLDASGSPVGVSKTRRFRVPAGVAELPMPDVSALKRKPAGIRPRMFLAGDRLQRIQNAVARGQAGYWEPLREAADAALREQPYAEPQGRRPGESFDQEWLRTFTPGKVGSAHLARCALMYKITGESKYLEGARRWMLTLAGWDPRGITSHGVKQAGGGVGNDEASMPMLERMAFAWDWMGDKLTAAERAKVLQSITERGNQVFQKMQEEDFLSHPYNNHTGRALAFLGDAGLAFLGDIPEADKWLDYVLRCYLTSYPGWGEDEGGWAQGISYWSIYVYWLTNFAEALREVTDVDLFKRPFYRNTGYLAVYFHPPYAPRGAFGDGGYHPPSEVETMLVKYLAGVYSDPVLEWQARELAVTAQKNTNPWREWFMEDVVGTWRAANEGGVPPKSPATLDGSRWFSDIGWVAMHSALGDAANDVWAMFKASRFGSYSHSHADQNTFLLNAYGHALAIDSGYYPSYGTPHDDLWTRQTMAHNGILVNGRGQAVFKWDADGQIEDYARQGAITMVRGQAANGYNVEQPREIVDLWRKLIAAPLPAMEPKVETAERTLAFVASRTRPVLVVQDYVRTGAPASFDWLLHALNQMETDGAAGAVYVHDGDARMAVRLVATAPYGFSQTNKFSVPPEAITNTAYVLGEEKFTDQWHLKATTRTPVREVKFLAILVPYRASEKQPEIVALQGEGMRGFRVGRTEVGAWWGAGESGKIAMGDASGEGRLLVKDGEQGSQAVAR